MLKFSGFTLGQEDSSMSEAFLTSSSLESTLEFMTRSGGTTGVWRWMPGTKEMQNITYWKINNIACFIPTYSKSIHYLFAKYTTMVFAPSDPVVVTRSPRLGLIRNSSLSIILIWIPLTQFAWQMRAVYCKEVWIPW